MAATFGLDFGTTNSLIALIAADPDTKEVGPRLLLDDGQPHPSVVWYSGGTPVVGRRAKEQLNEVGLGVFGDVVRSPKMYLGSPMGIDVGGITRQASDVVADVLRHLRKDALDRGFSGNPFTSAVITIPVSMRGDARAELRQAAAKAGITIHQFIHEPLAALYGHLRSQPNFGRALADLDRRLVLVFDWGGGTLDLTLCQIQHGRLMQVFNAGDPGVGGDEFDRRIQHLVRAKHEAQHPQIDWSRIQTGAAARLIQKCEDAKIALSTRESTTVLVPNLLATDGPERDVRVVLTRADLEGAVSDLVLRGLKAVDRVLDIPHVNRGAIEFCLATGGMVSMPAVQQGLREIFGVKRLQLAQNSATLIAEGTAWIAFDAVGLELAKPLEMLHADNIYVEILPAGTPLPTDGVAVQGGIDAWCVDPSDGFAKFLVARPEWPGQNSQGDPRVPYGDLSLPVDRHSQPLFERLKLEVTIDHDLVARLRARSALRGEERDVAIHDLEFGLSMSSAPKSGNGRRRG